MANEVGEDDNSTDVQVADIVGNQDWFLTHIIENIINQGVEIGVTLTISGQVVSGMLIGGKTYFKELGQLIAGASKKEGDIYDTLGEDWPKNAALYEKPEDASDDWVEPLASYLHLREAYYLNPGQSVFPVKPGMLWRGRISRVDGFSIGNISVD
ncbi:hypothetical protein G4G27_06210 [Sphingomonas sp. So64.6b]|uniref:hypothetical protein n=1 Tax=Sphingomonas sp. So64.6b TaxID=2997354 RepID=UPI001602409A|nr:hypothetical protein [Sphingomonas sp. So64.6b]QNA83635.1 hypothetical protein G4G27_06210 [Sphingomonas sp. So64.6b]